MLRTSVSRNKRVCMFVFRPHFGRRNVSSFKRHAKLSFSQARKAEYSTTSGPCSGKDEQCEKCKKIIELVFGPSKDVQLQIIDENQKPEFIKTPEPHVQMQDISKHKMGEVASTLVNVKHEDKKGQRNIHEGLDTDITNKEIEHVTEVPILQTTTSKENEEKLLQKLETIEETPLVEAATPKQEGFNVTPKVLGHENSSEHHKDNNMAYNEKNLFDETSNLNYSVYQTNLAKKTQDHTGKVDVKKEKDILVEKEIQSRPKAEPDNFVLSRNHQSSRRNQHYCPQHNNFSYLQENVYNPKNLDSNNFRTQKSSRSHCCNFAEDTYKNRKTGSPETDFQISIDELAKRCLNSPSNQIDERLLKEMEKLAIAQTETRASSTPMFDDVIQIDVHKKTKKIPDSEIIAHLREEQLEESTDIKIKASQNPKEELLLQARPYSKQFEINDNFHNRIATEKNHMKPENNTAQSENNLPVNITSNIKAMQTENSVHSDNKLADNFSQTKSDAISEKIINPAINKNEFLLDNPKPRYENTIQIRPARQSAKHDKKDSSHNNVDHYLGQETSVEKITSKNLHKNAEEDCRSQSSEYDKNVKHTSISLPLTDAKMELPNSDCKLSPIVNAEETSRLKPCSNKIQNEATPQMIYIDRRSDPTQVSNAKDPNMDSERNENIKFEAVDSVTPYNLHPNDYFHGTYHDYQIDNNPKQSEKNEVDTTKEKTPKSQISNIFMHPPVMTSPLSEKVNAENHLQGNLSSLGPSTKLKDEELTLSQLLRRIRERNKMNEYKDFEEPILSSQTTEVIPIQDEFIDKTPQCPKPECPCPPPPCPPPPCPPPPPPCPKPKPICPPPCPPPPCPPPPPPCPKPKPICPPPAPKCPPKDPCPPPPCPKPKPKCPPKNPCPPPPCPPPKPPCPKPKPACPPPAPKCPPKKPCPPPPPPCPKPCKPACPPPKKSPCAKFIKKCTVTLGDIIQILLLGQKNLKFTPTLSSDIVENFHFTTWILKAMNFKGPLSDSAGESNSDQIQMMRARHFELWTPIPSCLVPEDRKRSLVSPEDDHKDLAPVVHDINLAFKPKQCPGIPKRSFSTPNLISSEVYEESV